MRKLLIGFLQILFLAFDWFCIPIAAALIPCFLISRFLFPLPHWVFFVSGTVLLLVNWLVHPFAMGVILLPVYIWGWLHPPGRAPSDNNPPTASGSQTPKERP
ncbi:MAG TPA: hypothetical protein VK684_11065 [Edaphobacter sp.]|nr:hypothetical protein [Edaphobacter sp.]